ncbi:MAG TPA: hypothetical protein VHX63_14220 [Acidobacteriaceae bacterium]|jgi:hypothetical protein|nr:hypothetical protein [Acidobacteriaceae bacterium]
MHNRLHIFAQPEHAVLSLEVQAGLAQQEKPEQSQFQLLVRLFLERFFNNDMVAADDEGMTRLLQIACATGLPGFIVALYLWAPYHDLFSRARPYWAQVSDHYFFVVYSFVAMGIITVFEWDMFFPDLLDVFVLSSLPIRNRRLFLARIAAVCIFIVGFLFNSNFLAPLVLPAAIDPPNLGRFLAGHILAVAMSGIFAASLVLALQGVLLSVFGERFFRKVSLFLQGIFITVLLMLLFLLPLQSLAMQTLLHPRNALVLYFPPFWFLGIYQRLMEGPSALPIYTKLAQTGCWATLLTIAVAFLAYPFAYWRRTRQLMEGAGARDVRSWVAGPTNRILHTTVLRIPVRRAIYHFISQTLLRVQRYRIYLVLYAGVGLSLVTAAILRISVWHEHISVVLSPDGLRAAIPMVAFLAIAGLRTAFVSPGDQRGNWVFRTIQGKPGLEPLQATKIWVFVWGTFVTLGVVGLLHTIAPRDLKGWRATTSQVLVAIGLCLLLTDAFFLRVKIIPFTGVQAAVRTNLAIVVMKYFAFFPPVVLIVLSWEPWIASSAGHMVIAVLCITATHFGFQRLHQKIVSEHLSLVDLEEGEDEFPQRLGLRY